MTATPVAFGVVVAAMVAAGAARAQHPTVTLDEAIALALRIQPGIVQARGDLDVAHASQREAIGNYLPTLSANSSMSQNSSNRWNPQTQQFLSQPRSVSYSTGLNASLLIFDGFSRLAQAKAAGATTASADASLTNQRFQVILQTKQAFFNALAAADLVLVSQTQVERSLQQLRISKDRLAAGSAIRSDTLRSTVDAGNARLQLLNAQAQQATAEATLARLIGVDGSVQATGTPGLPDLTRLDTAALREEVVRVSPAVETAEAQARAAGAQVGVSRAQYLPTISANYSQSWAGVRDSVGLAPNSFTTWPRLGNSWSLRFSLSWPLFNGFSRETALSRSVAGRDAAEARAADARRQANATFTQQLAAFHAAGQQVTIAEASRAAADEDLRVQQERYRLGAATIVDVLTSQVSLGQAEVTLVQARLNLLVALAELEALLGREL
ncbi:MAG TPA: TolC family protein [Gemmatimonadales bacterium]